MVKYNYPVRYGAGGRNGAATIAELEIGTTVNSELQFIAVNEKGAQISGSFISTPLENVPDLLVEICANTMKIDSSMREKLLASLRSAMIEVEMSPSLSERDSPAFYSPFD